MSTVYEKMKKICDNIRSRTGGTELLTLDGIAQAILTIGGNNKPLYTNIIDTIGYTDDYRINSSNEMVEQAGYVTTGMIDGSTYTRPYTIRTKGVNFTQDSVPAIHMYREDGTRITYTTIVSAMTHDKWNGYTITADADGNLTIVVNEGGSHYCRITGYGKGSNLIITINEEIIESSDNNIIGTITDGNVVMLTGDLPDGGWTFKYKKKDGRLLTIGNLVLGVVNQLPISQEMDSTNPFNGVGYMTEYYLTSSTPYYKESSSKNDWLTGYIPYTIDKTIYIKNVSFTAAQHDRMYFFSDKATRVNPAIGYGTTELETYFTVEQLGTNYTKLTPISGTGLLSLTQWVRFGFTTGTPSEVIITVDEPIE